MKIAVVSKFHIKLKKEILEAGLDYDSKKPDLVISLGGDGTFFRSERAYPGVPKLIVKKSKHCKKCAAKVFNQELLKKVKDEKFRIKEHIKLEANIKRNGKIIRRYVCANDFVLRNKNQINALRFSVKIDGRPVDDELMGDGIVVSTPFGSTGYFNSITRNTFEKGIGVAFNNLTEEIKHKILKENSKIEIKILRTDGIFSSDNNPKMIVLKKGDNVKIKKSSKKMVIVELT